MTTSFFIKVFFFIKNVLIKKHLALTRLIDKCTFIIINPCFAEIPVSIFMSFEAGIANAISSFKWRKMFLLYVNWSHRHIAVTWSTEWHFLWCEIRLTTCGPSMTMVKCDLYLVSLSNLFYSGMTCHHWNCHTISALVTDTLDHLMESFHHSAID